MKLRPHDLGDEDASTFGKVFSRFLVKIIIVFDCGGGSADTGPLLYLE